MFFGDKTNKKIMGMLLVFTILTITLGCSTGPSEADLEKAKDYYNNGLDLMSQGKYPESITEFDKSLKIDPNNKEVWLNKGLSLANQSKYSESLESIDRSIAIDQKYKEAWFYKGRVYQQMVKHSEAVECFDKAIAIDPNYADAWGFKSASVMILGDFWGALAIMQRAQELGFETDTEQNVSENEPLTNTPSTIMGKGDDVVSFDATGTGIRVFTINHMGTSGNFAVWLKDSQGNTLNLLVNEIGQYYGKKSHQLKTGKYYLDVTASGYWTIEIQ